MTDKFELAATAVAKGLVESIPGGSVISNLFEALTTGNNEAFQQQLHEEVLDATLELKRRIDLIEEQLKKQGKELEELGALRTRKCFADFAAAYAETTGDGKREALLNVAARQFDSSLQTLDLRAFWFSVVRSLSDYEIVVLRELAVKHRIAVVAPHIAYTGTQEVELESNLDLAAAFTLHRRAEGSGGTEPRFQTLRPDILAQGRRSHLHGPRLLHAVATGPSHRPRYGSDQTWTLRVAHGNACPVTSVVISSAKRSTMTCRGRVELGLGVRIYPSRAEAWYYRRHGWTYEV